MYYNICYRYLGIGVHIIRYWSGFIWRSGKSMGLIKVFALSQNLFCLCDNYVQLPPRLHTLTQEQVWIVCGVTEYQSKGWK